MLAQWPLRAGIGGIAVMIAAYWATLGTADSSQSLLSSSERPAPQGLIQITADATATSEPEDIFSVCKLTSFPRETFPSWFTWLFGGRVRMAASSNAESLPVYGVILPDGAALCVVNHADIDAAYKVSIRLTRGLYSVEQIVFEKSSQETSPPGKRLQSVIMDATGVLRKPGQLRPGMVAIYRFINRSRQTSNLFRVARDQMESLRPLRPVEFRRLMVPLQECGAHIGALSGGIRTSERSRCLKHIHRALLTLSHAQALCRNYRIARRIPSEYADDIQKALDNLEQTLTELSIGCLDLVPHVEIPVSGSGVLNARQLTVSLTNAGPFTISFIRMGIEAPDEITIRPQEPAFFRQLGPGQSAQASFTMMSNTANNLQSMFAYITYVIAGVPARVRLAL
jgi:hypothetical protein